MTMSSHPTVVVRDLVRKRVHRLEASGTRDALLVPNDFLVPEGPVAMHDGVIEYAQGGHTATGRTVPCSLDTLHPGQRVLLQLPPDPEATEARTAGASEAPAATAGELRPEDQPWWLCEVEEVDGLAAN
jgi:hypothetical protein